MKIIKIEFKNINNLKGVNVISFEDEPLRSAGIFAITGPTGSGKSTILDVITLALFNKIPRFKGSISKSTIEGLGSVITHHMDEASASITYEIHNKVYTSTWTVSKNRNGKLRDYEMFIYNADGTPLDLKKSEVPGRNEEIIGLKYDQFVKSIILSQGQFSRFLKADKSERGQLLENLTGSSIYRKISIAAYEKFKVVKDEVALEKDRLEHIQTLSDDARVALTEQIRSNQDTKTVLDAELQKLNSAKQLKTEVERFGVLLNEKKAQKEALKLEIGKYKERLTRLDTYEQLSPIVGELTRYRDAKLNHQNLIKEVERHIDQELKYTASRKLVMEEMSRLTQEAITVDNFGQVMSAFEKEINALNQEILHIAKTGKETRQKIVSKAARYNITADPNPAIALPQLKSKIESRNAEIKHAGLALNSDIDEISKNHSNISIDLKQLKELHHAYEHKASSAARLDDAVKNQKKYFEEEQKYKPIVATSNQLVLTSKENIKLLERQKQDALLIAKLSDHRASLVEGEPCPLCGAEDHPFAEHLPQEDSELSKNINAAKQKLIQYENEFAVNNKKLTESQTSRRLIETQMEVYKIELEKATKEQQSKYSAYGGSASKDEANIVDSIAKVEEKRDALTIALKAIQNRTVLLELVDDYEALHSVLIKHGILTKNKKTRYSGQDVSEECNTLQNRFIGLNSQMATVKKVIENDKAKLILTEKYINETAQILSTQVRALGFESIEDTASFIISEEDLKFLKSKKDSLAKRSTAIETEMRNLISSIEMNEKSDLMPSVDLSEINKSIVEKSGNKEAIIKSIGENTAVLQNDDQERERIKTKETQLVKLQRKLDKWSLLNKMIGEKTGNKFANFAQGLTLQNLLVFANKRLQKLSDRYLLDKPFKDGALTVIDQYQGNIQRSVSTLSGGESFLISLALALSLSDMASKNVNLESLFIDEGFGTLDQESLNVAMDTLEKLQTESQKTVGVISHVEALKDRIHVQIKLDKNSQGYGALRVVN